MGKGWSGAAGLAACVAVSGCAGMPSYRLGQADAGHDPSSPLVAHLICEVAGAQRFGELRDKKYQVKVALTLTVNDSAGITPAVSFIHPGHVSPKSRTDALNAELSQTRKRTLTENVAISLDAVDRSEACAADKAGGIRGSFHLDALVDNELARTPLKGVAYGDDKAGLFGSTVEFTLKRGVGGGPSWVRAHFKGPGDKLLAASRTDTSSLVIAFAKPGKGAQAGGPERSFFEQLLSPEQKRMFEGLVGPARSPEEAAKAEAQAAASGLVTQMILQNLAVGGSRGAGPGLAELGWRMGREG